MSSRRNKSDLLARVNFPLYTLQMLTSRHILVGGGGGMSNTGIANGFEIFELSHDGKKFVAEEVTRHETGSRVVMNCSTFNDGKRTLIVAGQESHCQLYTVQSKVVTLENGQVETEASKDVGVRQRRKSENSSSRQTLEEIPSDSPVKTKKRLQLRVHPADSIQTDFCEKEPPLQRVVRVSPNGKFMATGGIDGVIRLWKFPQLASLDQFHGHSNEIDDLDFSPDGKTLCSIAKDGKAILWDVASGKSLKELTWEGAPGSNVKHMYKRCRFRRGGESNSRSSQLFLLSNSKGLSYLQLWDTEKGAILKSASFRENLSALAVSDNGTFVAVGTMSSGSVDIFVAFNLKRALRVPRVHGMFVTGLEFLPTKLDGPGITSNTEAAVISISVDNKICIHSVPFRSTLPIWLVLIFIVISICAAFILCSYLGI